MTITLYTSVHPAIRRTLHGQEVGDLYLGECLSSWHAAGFEIASLNRPDEIEVLVERYPFVRFHQTGSKKPRISEFISLIEKSSHPVAGIFNCDCIYFGAKSACEIEGDVGDGLVLYERLNFDRTDLAPTGICFGFDAFIFSTSYSARTIDPDITIGQSWWDYMFPLAYLDSGGQITSVETKLLHLDHPYGYDNDQYLDGAAKTLDLFGRRLGADSSFRDEGAPYDIRTARAVELAARCFDHLRSQGRPDRDTPIREQMVCALHQRAMALKTAIKDVSDRAARQERAAWARRLDGPANRLLGELLCTIAGPFRNYRPTRRFAETAFSLGDDLQLRADQKRAANK